MRALRRILTGLAVSAAALALLGPATAFASSVSKSGGAVTYTGAAGEANHVTFSFNLIYGVYVITDTGVSAITVPTWATGCHTYTAQIAYCDFGTISAITARLGNGGSFAESKLIATPMTFYAGSGSDTLIGGGAADTLVGGSGRTTMMGAGGRNAYQGGSGIDTITSRNGVSEDVACAASADSVIADPSDITAADCETVDRGIATPPPPVADPGDTPLAPGIGAGLSPFKAPVANVSSAAVTLTVGNEVPVRLGCPIAAAAGCEGSIVLSVVATPRERSTAGAARRAKRRQVSRVKHFRIKAGANAVVPVALSRRGGRKVRRALRGRKSLKLAATVVMRSEAGTHTTTQNITVKSARRAPRAKPKRKRR